MHKFKDSFSRNEWDIGVTSLAEHSIKTGDADPIKQPPRRVPLAFADKEKHLVSKKDGGVRLCVDYRKVNELVKPDGFPLPRIQDCLDAVAGSRWFSTFDLTSETTKFH